MALPAASIKMGPEGIDLPLADREIRLVVRHIGGNLLKQSQWMVHVWSVPGWESGQARLAEPARAPTGRTNDR